MSNVEAAPTPAPAATDPSPLTVGTQFVKKYYQVLSTSPADIDKFYKNSTSIVTRGEGSDTAEVIATDCSDGAAAARFFTTSSNDEQIRFELKHGAIDAQYSVNSALLLVVTGQVVYVNSAISKSFVHTFFLGSTVTGPNNTRSYYVHNDILRFLDMQLNQVGGSATAQVNDSPALEETSAVASSEGELISGKIEDLTPTVETLVESNVQDPPVVKEEPELVKPVVSETKSTEVVNSEAPGHGVEESKVAILDDEVSAASKSASVPVAPGSWASLVKRTAPTAASPPATPMRSEKPNSSTNGANAIPQHSGSATQGKVSLDASTQPIVAAASGTASKSTASAPAQTDVNSSKSSTNVKQQQQQQQAPPQQQYRPKREAECTLIVKNIDMEVTESEIKSMFEPFITDTSANYVGCTVQGQRGIAFVDFDSPEPVVKAVKQHAEVKFTIRGRELDIYQKVFVDKNQHRGGGHRFQGNSNNNGRDYYRSGGGGGGGGADGGGRNGGRNFRRGSGRTAGRSAAATMSSGDN